MSDKDPALPSIEYGPEDEDENATLEPSQVQVMLWPIYVVLLLTFLATATIPFVFLGTIIHMTHEVRTEQAEEPR
jgi:hypothetical protein